MLVHIQYYSVYNRALQHLFLMEYLIHSNISVSSNFVTNVNYSVALE